MTNEQSHFNAVDPAVTVIMPVYNAEATIEATVQSVLDQSFQNFELIIVNDGSTDNSVACAMAFSVSDARVRLVSRRNAGVSSARNLGAELAKAPLLAFIDADDLWDPSKLEQHAALHRAQPHLAASYARIAFIAPDATDLSTAKTTSSLCPHRPMLMDVLGDNPVCTTSNLVIRRDWYAMLGGFNAALSYAEDQDLVARLVNQLGILGGIDAVLTGYRFSPDGLSMNLDHMYAGWRTVALQFLSDDELRPLDALYCRYMARRVLRAAGSPQQSLKFALAGLRLDAATFLHDRKRGVGTLIAALMAPIVPALLRQRIFA
jgi:glycosyltransferase involved in cell wall biosynthesis